VLLDPILDAVLTSAPMAVRLQTAERSLAYVSWVSRRLAASETASVASAEAVARRHGLLEPLHLSSAARGGHAWAHDSEWVDAFMFMFMHMPAHTHTPARAQAKAAAPVEKPKRQRRSLPAAVRSAVWNAWNGRASGVAPCTVCGTRVSQQDFECGHVVAASLGGPDTVENLRPVCRLCNRSMGTENLHEFRARYFGDPMEE
jgi:5-methylcytosine-specific restriction endonuclease McrA